LTSWQSTGLSRFDPDNFDTDSLIGIEQKVSVEEYKKTMGVNIGQPGNRITQVMPLVRKKTASPRAQAAARPQRAAAGDYRRNSG
jgi:hypothetical protein